MTPEMLDSPESYMLVVVCNESVFVEKMAAEIHLDDSNLRTLSLEAPEGSELSAAEIGSIDVDDDSHLIVNIPLPAEGSIKLAPCKYFVYFTGAVDGIDIDTFAVVNIAQADQTWISAILCARLHSKLLVAMNSSSRRSCSRITPSLTLGGCSPWTTPSMRRLAF